MTGSSYQPIAPCAPGREGLSERESIGATRAPGGGCILCRLERPAGNLNLANTAAWSGYLASSWTWCIGMFLPVLLMRDHGWLAWVIFAAPNVIGAAAMGWTVRGAEHSREMVAAHRPAMLAFSVVTRAFQWYFVLGLLARSNESSTLPAVAGALAISIALAASDLRRRTVPWSGLIVWAVSMALLAGAFRLGDLPSLGTSTPSLAGPVSLLGLLAVSVFGFLLCPYLDLTFHRACAEAKNPRAAFGVGFGVHFLAMIVGTAAYSGVPWRIEGLTAILIGLHMAFQIGFTAEAHSAEILAHKKVGDDLPLGERLVRHLPLISLVIGIASLAAVGACAGWLGGKSSAFEWGYRVWMGFYGLVFPAYVLIAVVPTWGKPVKPTPAMVRAWAVGSLVAMPASYLAFIKGTMWWAGPVMAVVLTAALISRRAAAERPVTIKRTQDEEEALAPKDDQD